MISPTQRTYTRLNEAYTFFNTALFEGALPHCLITMQRRRGTYGYFHGERFATPDGKETTDEIALNPSHFKARTTEQVLSTFVHEMVHLWQHHFGKPGRGAYHNKEWATRMRSVGLIPSSTGEEGGSETGQKMTHYPEPDGRFQRACGELLATGFSLPYVEVIGDEEETQRAKKAATKTKHTCLRCAVNAWAKAGTILKCGRCDIIMQAEPVEAA